MEEQTKKHFFCGRVFICFVRYRRSRGAGGGHEDSVTGQSGKPPPPSGQHKKLETRNTAVGVPL